MRAHAISAGIALLILFAPPALADGTVYTGDYHTLTPSGWGAYGGGVFTFSLAPDRPGHPTSGFAGTTVEHGIGSVFQTFCLETGEVFYPGRFYRATVDTTIKWGHPEPNAFGNGANPVSNTVLAPQTAFLYSKFRSGALAAAVPTATTNDLQAAIWFYQLQATEDWVYTHYTPAVIDALRLFADTGTAGSAYWSGLGDVRVLNLFDWNDTPGQSELVLIPLPGSGILASAGLALACCVAGARRAR
jgi:hypothetical protein